ncbi:hypothetical protein [Mucilaginibacter glaciei]|uniref:Lipocalin-like protein n=1 Tax=Mucilaginibacter glaciei TaxID=2772109 RepID=A0A926S0U5_9SPHI|nr:hypothetical protein [Mucilaginibacter glaciei]MBD1392097.1 hypothetical protein [Mucilaginibacter glaciei]
MIRRILFLISIIIALCSFNAKPSLRGVWEYAGDIYNGKKQSAATNYKLQRKYDDTHYDASFLEVGEKPVIYERGDYLLKQDTCIETQTYTSQPSKILGISIKYIYQIKNDTLTLSGTLPNGSVVQEYWKRVK